MQPTARSNGCSTVYYCTSQGHTASNWGNSSKENCDASLCAQQQTGLSFLRQLQLQLFCLGVDDVWPNERRSLLQRREQQQLYSVRPPLVASSAVFPAANQMNTRTFAVAASRWLSSFSQPTASVHAAAAAAGIRAGSPAAEASVASAEVCVSVPPRCISIVRGPEALYSAILGCIQSAKHRLLISALYIGTEAKERFMLQKILQHMQQQQSLEVRLLLDFLRSTRPGATGERPATLLLPLLQQLPHSRCQVSLFYNPLTCSDRNGGSKARRLLHKLLLKVLSHRHKEALGTQHMKFVVSDDLLLLTGANLSGDYFTNRTDRCCCIRSKPLADAVERILAAAEDHSFRLLPQQQKQRHPAQQQQQHVDIGGVSCLWPRENPCKAPNVDADGFCRSLSNSMSAALAIHHLSCGNGSSGSNGSNCNNSRGSNQSGASEGCLVSLTVQAGFASPPVRGQQMFLERIHSIATKSLSAAANTPVASVATTKCEGFVQASEEGGSIQVTLASPYLNFPPDFLQRLQHLVQQMRASTAASVGRSSGNGSNNNSGNVSNKPQMVVVTASPEANSFYKSKGLSYWIPPAYAVAAHTTATSVEGPSGSATVLAAASPVAAPAASAATCVQQLQQQQDPLELLEFSRPGWTYHAKGVWITSRSSTIGSINDCSSRTSSIRDSSSESYSLVGQRALGPDVNSTRTLLEASLACHRNSKGGGSNKSRSSGSGAWRMVSLLGSSNLSMRSSRRDLELLALLQTRDLRLHQEHQREVQQTLLLFARPVTKETLRSRFPWWLKFAIQRLGLDSLL